MGKSKANKPTEQDLFYLNKAMELAEVSGREGNMPIGAVVVLDGKIIAEGRNKGMQQKFHPSAHAEMEALARIDLDLLNKRSKEMTLYATLEPCVMCYGTTVLHRIGRLVYGICDVKRGATYVGKSLVKKYGKAGIPTVIGPALPPEIAEKYTAEYLEAYKRYKQIRDGAQFNPAKN